MTTSSGEAGESVAAFLARARDATDRALDRALGEVFSGVTPALGAAVRYAVMGSGKRIRPALPIIMLAAFCGVPCHQQDLVTACLGRGEPPSALLHALQKMIGGGAPGQIAA